MRITRDTLVEVARETVEKRIHSDHGIVAAYLTGSLRTENPFLGNATDIDIVFVHETEPEVRREILPLTPEVHQDIRHNPSRDYDKPKELRVHPWLGPELYDPLPLHVTGHFFEFVQAGVRDKFHDQENMLARARSLAGSARQSWNGLQTNPASGPEWVLAYLATVQLAANSLALLGGDPLSERRFLLQFPLRAEACGHPELTRDLFSLLGADLGDAAAVTGWLPEWEKSFLEAASNPRSEKRVSPPRLGYYKLACQSYLDSGNPGAAVWPMLLTWTISACVLPKTSRHHWSSACGKLGFSDETHSQKMDMLDHFLDSLEDILKSQASSLGV